MAFWRGVSGWGIGNLDTILRHSDTIFSRYARGIWMLQRGIQMGCLGIRMECIGIRILHLASMRGLFGCYKEASGWGILASR